MSKHDEFEDFLRNEFEKNPIEYKDEYWLQAEQLIIANEKKERRKLFIYIFSAAALLCIVAGLYCIKNESSNSVNKTDVSINNFPNNNSNKTSGDNTNQLNNKKFTNQNNYSLENSMKAIGNNTATATTNKTLTNEKHHINVLLNNHTKSKSLTLNINTKSKSKTRKSDKQQQFEANNITTSSSETISLDENNVTLFTDEMLLLPTTFSENEIEMNCIRLNDFEKISPGEKIKTPTLEYYLIGGAAVYKGFGNGTGYTTHPVAGIGVSYKVSEKFNADINILYIERGKVNASKQFYSELYDFGYSNETKIISTSKIKYLTLPVFMKYTFQKNQSLIAGVSFGYLLSSNNDINKSTGNDTGTLVRNNSKESGYVNGFKKYDIGIVAGFQSKLLKNLNANIQLNYGLVDITKDAYYANKSKDRNISIALTFRYDILRK